MIWFILPFALVYLICVTVEVAQKFIENIDVKGVEWKGGAK